MSVFIAAILFSPAVFNSACHERFNWLYGVPAAPLSTSRNCNETSSLGEGGGERMGKEGAIIILIVKEITGRRSLRN